MAHRDTGILHLSRYNTQLLPGQDLSLCVKYAEQGYRLVGDRQYFV